MLKKIKGKEAIIKLSSRQQRKGISKQCQYKILRKKDNRGGEAGLKKASPKVVIDTNLGKALE